jgi:tight adherence protein B
MSVAPLIAFAAATSGVVGAWDLLSAVQGGRVAALWEAAVAPLRRAGAEGHAPSAPERRRLAALCAGSLLAAGWLVAGPLAGLVAALLGPAAGMTAVRARRARYAAEVRRGAAAAARALAAAVGAGRSVRTAVADAADALDGPAGRELRLAARALALGEPTEPVLERLRVRAGGRAWDTLVAALLLQREAGGDLAGLLGDLAASLEDAARAERDAHAATAQSRASARIVTALPVLAAGFAELGSPGFLASLLGTPVSAVLTILAALLQIVAFVAIRRLTRPPAVVVA